MNHQTTTRGGLGAIPHTHRTPRSFALILDVALVHGQTCPIHQPQDGRRRGRSLRSCHRRPLRSRRTAADRTIRGRNRRRGSLRDLRAGESVRLLFAASPSNLLALAKESPQHDAPASCETRGGARSAGEKDEPWCRRDRLWLADYRPRIDSIEGDGRHATACCSRPEADSIGLSPVRAGAAPVLLRTRRRSSRASGAGRRLPRSVYAT